MARVIDYAWGRPSVASLKAAGAVAVSRYLSYDQAGKNLTRAEADGLRASGIDVVSNWEHYGDWLHDYSGGHANGVLHAAEADRQHLTCGGPAGRPIYFSTDFPATDAQLPTVADYYRGVASVIGLDRTGAYGSYSTIRYLFDIGVIRWGWQTYAWSNGQWDPRAQVRQVRNGVLTGGVDSDLNDTMTSDFGQWGAGMALTDDDIARIWAYKVGGPANNREAHFALSDARDMVLSGKSSYDGQAYYLPTELAALVAAIGAVGQPTDAQLTAQATSIANALVASRANGLTPADHAALVADVKQALREGAA